MFLRDLAPGCLAVPRVTGMSDMGRDAPQISQVAGSSADA
jgi:hypothetical protein